MVCPSCHTPNRDNAKFCKKCGLSFTAETVGAAFAGTQGQHQQSAHADQSQAAPASAMPTEQAPASAGAADDPSLAPTQILSPQQMLAYQTRRWQQELERQQGGSGEHGIPDIAEAPTLLIKPTSETPVPPAHEQEARDIAAMPTIAMPRDVQGEQKTQVNHAPIAPPPPPEAPVPPTNEQGAASPQQEEEEEPIQEAGAAKTQATTSATVAETSASGENTPATLEEEDVMEQELPPTTDQTEQDQAAQPVQADQEAQDDAFPVLAVGTTVAGRYEVTQVISEEEEEHIYQVTDHQGYQHCWNCGSEENTTGDEFCIDCGAELLNASYIMHEYPASQGKDNDAHVLQGSIMNTFVDQGHTYMIEQPQAVQTAFPNGVHLMVASDSDAGNMRRGEPNEDSTLVLQFQRIHESLATPAGVFIVADGMGGHDNGQLASRMAIGAIAERMTRELLLAPLSAEKAGETPQAMDEDDLVSLLHGSVEDANTAICQVNQREKTDMGSTITGFMVVGDHAYILNVGDSRTYMMRDGTLYQLTNDHSLVGQLVAGGLIEPDDVYTHPQRSQIYRSLGDKLNVQIDIFKQQIHPGDVLLSCCDGLWEMVRDPQITEILVNASDPQTACTQLIEAANANGGEDNISAVVVYVH